MERLTIADIPALPGYLSVHDAATVFNVTKTTIRLWIYTRVFTGVVKIGNDAEDARPRLLIPTGEVERVLAETNQVEQRRAERDVPREWNRRVKQHFRSKGGRANEAGPPTREMVKMYEADHPEDPRP